MIVYWVGSRVSKRWKSATVAAHERHGEFWLEYDDHFDNKGNQFFLEKMLTSGGLRERLVYELREGVSF